MDNLEEMDKFLEMYNLPSLNQEEVENINRLITSNEIESVMKQNQNTAKKQSPGFLVAANQMASQGVKEELTAIFLKLFQKIEEKGTLIPQDHHYPHTKTRQRYNKKETYRPISLMNIDAKP